MSCNRGTILPVRAQPRKLMTLLNGISAQRMRRKIITPKSAAAPKTDVHISAVCSTCPVGADKVSLARQPPAWLWIALLGTQGSRSAWEHAEPPNASWLSNQIVRCKSTSPCFPPTHPEQLQAWFSLVSLIAKTVNLKHFAEPRGAHIRPQHSAGDNVVRHSIDRKASWMARAVGAQMRSDGDKSHQIPLPSVNYEA